jgi:hypothetical protein
MTAAGRERDWWMFPFWVVLIGSLGVFGVFGVQVLTYT